MDHDTGHHSDEDAEEAPGLARPHRLADPPSALRPHRRTLLWTTANERKWGALHLTTVGRKSGQERKVIIGYLEDGPNLVAIAMNGWDEGHPALWLNLQAHPEAWVRLARQDPLVVRAREAAGEERDRLWRR